MQGPRPSDAGVERIVVHYGDGRVYTFIPEGGRRRFSEDDALHMAEVLDKASSRAEWADLTDQEL
jgi:hypothetical protein